MYAPIDQGGQPYPGQQQQPVYTGGFQQQVYGGPAVAYGQPVVVQPVVVAPYGGATSPYAEPSSPLPASTDKPVLESGYRDTFFAVLFWVHLAAIAGCAFVLGVPAVKADAASSDDDPNRSALDFNASLFIRIIGLACAVGGVVSAAFVSFLRRYSGGLIACSLYTSLVIQAATVGAMFYVSAIAGAIMCIPLLFTAIYVYYVRRRIPFAAAHVSAAVAATRGWPSLFLFSVAMLLVQAAWVMLWSLAAFGVEHRLNNSSGDASGSGTQPTSGKVGSTAVFVLLISLYWGAQVWTNVVHYVTAAVVGSWWFIGKPASPVRAAITRAFTFSFGSIAFGSLVVAVIKALRQAAKSAERRAQEKNNVALAIFACLALCILSIVERLVEYLNTWAYTYCALTGCDFKSGGKAAWHLFTKRGWTAIVNDDLIGNALGIGCLCVAGISAAVGGGVTYIALGSSPTRGTVTGIAAFFCFLVGFIMCSILTGVLTSAVRSVFVCFALNPAALGATHPEHLQTLVSSWQQFHANEWAACGYAGAFGSTAGGYIAPEHAHHHHHHHDGSP